MNSLENENIVENENMVENKSSDMEIDTEQGIQHDEVKGLDDDEKEKTFTLTSKDGESFEITEKASKLSTLITTAISGNQDDTDVPLPAVNGSILALIVQYLNYHATSPVPENNLPEKLKSNVFADNVESKWDVTFIEETVMNNKDTAKETLYDLIKASNYMEIKPLLHLGCAKVASMIKGKSLDKIKDILSPETEYNNTHVSS